MSRKIDRPPLKKMRKAESDGVIQRILSAKPEEQPLTVFLESIGLPYSTFADWRSGRRFPNDEKLYALAEAMDVRFEWLRRGEGGPEKIDLSKYDEDYQKALMPTIGEAFVVPLYSGTVKQAPMEFETEEVESGRFDHQPIRGSLMATEVSETAIPTHEPRWAAGQPFKVIALRLDNLGESMAPLIPADAIIFVDRLYGSLKDGAIYAVRLEDGSVTVRYVKEMGGRFVLFAANAQESSPQLVTWTKHDDELIVGRVVSIYRDISGVTAK